MIVTHIQRIGKRKSVKRKINFLIFFIVVLILIISTVLFTPVVRISTIRVAEDVGGVIEKSDIASYIFKVRENSTELIPIDIKYLFISDRIESDLIMEYSRIESVQTKWAWWNKLTLLVNERYSYINFCNDSQCGIADKNAYILELNKDDFLPTIFTTNSIIVRETALNENDMLFLKTAIDYLGTLGISTKSVEIVSTDGYKGQMNLITEHNVLVKLHPTDDLYAMTRLLYVAFIEKFGFVDDSNIGELDDIEYVDIRFNDYIVFKNKNE